MDYSGMTTLLLCPRLYKYQYVDKLAPAEEAPALNFGTAWHKIMEYHNKGHENPLEALNDLGYIDPAGDYRTREKLIKAYEMWRTQYAETPWEVLLAEQGVQGVDFEGRVDGVVRTRAFGEMELSLWLVDYKTTSRLETDWITTYHVSDQFKLYLRALRQQYPELRGVLVDVYHATKGNKSASSEGERIGNRFYRQYLLYEEVELQEANQDLRMALAVKDLYEQHGYWPKNTKACHHFNRACPFLDVCDAADPEIKARLLSGFKPNTFDPLAEG